MSPKVLMALFFLNMAAHAAVDLSALDSAKSQCGSTSAAQEAMLDTDPEDSFLQIGSTVNRFVAQPPYPTTTTTTTATTTATTATTTMAMTTATTNGKGKGTALHFVVPSPGPVPPPGPPPAEAEGSAVPSPGPAPPPGPPPAEGSTADPSCELSNLGEEHLYANEGMECASASDCGLGQCCDAKNPFENECNGHAARCGKNNALCCTVPQSPMPLTRPRIQSWNILARKMKGSLRASAPDGRLTAHNGEPFAFSMFRPEAVTFDAEGVPDFIEAFSDTVTVEASAGVGKATRKHMALCFTDRSKQYSILNDGKHSYKFFIFNTIGNDEKGVPRLIGRRDVTVVVSLPGTVDAAVHSATAGEEQIVSIGVDSEVEEADGTINPIEPTITADGKLMVMQKKKLVYSYSSEPCGLDTWTPFRYLHQLHSDSNTDLQNEQYGLASLPLYSAGGLPFESGNPLLGAYPWIDFDGRNVYFTASTCTDKPKGTSECNARREAYSFIGADTGGKLVHIDGAPNVKSARAGGRSITTHFGPMWEFADDRFTASPTNGGFLPVTPTHEVIPLWSALHGTYAEINIVDIWKAQKWDVLFLPFNDLVVPEGHLVYDKTPDLSGHFHNVSVNTQNAHLTETVATTRTFQTNSDNGDNTHSVGRALRVVCGTGATVALKGSGVGVESKAKGLTVQLSFLWPTADVDAEQDDEAHDAVLLQHQDADYLRMWLDASGTMFFKLNGITVKTDVQALRGHWTHFAARFDGEDKKLLAFVNGRFAGKKVNLPYGDVQIDHAGSLYIGGDGSDDDENYFVGYIDEVRIFGHARHHRNICKSAFGANCLGDVDYKPNDMQLHVSNQEKTCSSTPADETPNFSLACIRAYHAVCAVKGAKKKPTSPEALQELGSSLDVQIPMFGAPVNWQTHNDVQDIACGPQTQKSRAVEWYQLAEQDPGCKGEAQAFEDACLNAYTLMCKQHTEFNGEMATGTLFQATARAWVSCFNADEIEEPGACGSGFGAVPTVRDNVRKDACWRAKDWQLLPFL